MSGQTNQDFFTAVLRGMGLPVTSANLQVLAGVAHMEGLNNRFNPLNSVVPSGNSSAFNSVGVQDYKSFDNGVAGTIALLHGSPWTGVVSALRMGNNAQAVAQQFANVYQGWDAGVTASTFLNGGGVELSALSGSGGGAGTSSAGATALTTSTKLSASDYQDALANLSGLLTGVPELKALLQQAVSGGWAVTKFQQAVEQSKWYQTHNASARELISLKYSDPAEYQTKIANQRTQIENMASKLGLQLGPGRLEQIVQQSLIEGWDQQTLTNNLGRTFFNPKNPNQALTGDIGSAYDQMKAVYSDYGVPVSDATLRNNALRIAEGSVSLDAYKHNVLQTAKSMFPSISQQLDSGLTVKQVADPYIQTMSNILEVDPNTVGVTDPLVKKALQGASTTTGGKTTFMSTPVWQFEQQLRSDPRWSKTQNARDTISTALTQVGRDFGFSV